MRLNIALRNYQRIESGRQNLTLHTIAKVARALDAELFEVIAIPDNRPSSKLQVVRGDDGEPPRVVPVFEVEAAARYARTGRTGDALGWTLLSHTERYRRAFVAQVTGASMEPLIPSGAWCLFAPADVAADGQIGLFEIDNGAFVVRRVRRDDGSTSLVAVNRTHPPLSFSPDVRVVALWVDVVGLA